MKKTGNFMALLAFAFFCSTISAVKCQTVAKCPKGQTYGCLRLCDKTCPGPVVYICDGPCADGCYCSGDTVLNMAGQCVPLDKCPHLVG